MDIVVPIFIGKEPGAEGVKLFAQVTELMSGRAGIGAQIFLIPKTAVFGPYFQ